MKYCRLSLTSAGVQFATLPAAYSAPSASYTNHCNASPKAVDWRCVSANFRTALICSNIAPSPHGSYLMNKRTLYHVSPHFNTQSILSEGVSPAWSRGKLHVSWWITEEQLMWALAHISSRYAISVNVLAIFTASIDEALLLRTRWKGVYQCKAPVSVTQASAARNAVDAHEDALERAQTLTDTLA